MNWRITIKRGRAARRFVIEGSAEADALKIGDPIVISAEDAEPWTVTKKQPTTVIARIPWPPRPKD